MRILCFFQDRWATHRSAPLLFALHFGFCFLNSRVDMNNMSLGNIVYFYLSAVSGVMFYCYLCKRMKPTGILAYIGGNTIVIIGMIGISLFVVNGIWYLAFKTKPAMDGIGAGFAASLALTLLAVPAVYGINTWAPFLLGRTSSPHMKKGGPSVRSETLN